MASDALSSIDKIIDTNGVMIAQSQMKQNSSTKILGVLDKITKALSEDLNEENNTYVIEKRNIALRVSLINQTQDYVAVTSSNNRRGKVVVDIQQDSGSAFNDDVSGIIKLPKLLMENYKRPIVRAINHRNAILFLTEEQMKELSDTKKLTGKIATGNVLSASLGDHKLERLDQPVTISFKNASKSVGSGVCKFWDFDKGSFFMSFLPRYRGGSN